MRLTIQKWGNSAAVRLPPSILAQLGIKGDLDMTVENNAIVLRKPENRIRDGWAQASREVAAASDYKLVWPDFANSEDAELIW